MTASGEWAAPTDPPGAAAAGNQPAVGTEWADPGSGPAPRPGVVPLRPLGVGELLDGAVTTMRRYPKPTLGLSALVAVVVGLADFGVRALALTGGGTLLPAALGLLTIVVSTVGTALLAGGLTIVLGEAVLGRPITMGQTWQRLRPRLGALVGLAVLVGLLELVGLVLFVIPGIYLYAALALATPVLMLEGCGAHDALGRSRALVRGSWWRVFGILVLVGIVVLVITAVFEVPLTLLGLGTSGLVGQTSTASVGGLFLAALGQIIASTIVAPLSAHTTALIYVDQRMRREGLDITLAQAAQAPPSSSA